MKNVSLNAPVLFFSLYIPRREEEKMEKIFFNCGTLSRRCHRSKFRMPLHCHRRGVLRGVKNKGKREKFFFFQALHLLFVSLSSSIYFIAILLFSTLLWECERIHIFSMWAMRMCVLTQGTFLRAIFSPWNRRRHRAAAFSIKWREMSLFVE